MEEIPELHSQSVLNPQYILNLQAKILLLEERLKKVEEDNRLFRVELG